MNSHNLDFNINFDESFVFHCGSVVGFYSPKNDRIDIHQNKLNELSYYCFEKIDVFIDGLELFIIPDFIDREYSIFKLKEVFNVNTHYVLDPLKMDKHDIKYKIYDAKQGVFETTNVKELLMLDCYTLDYFTSDWFGEVFEVRYGKKSKGWSSDGSLDYETLTIKDIIMVNKDVEYDCETIIRRLYYHLSLFNYLNYVHKKMVKLRQLFYYSVVIIVSIGIGLLFVDIISKATI